MQQPIRRHRCFSNLPSDYRGIYVRQFMVYLSLC